MSLPMTPTPLLTPDSAWRQYRRATEDRKARTAAEQADPYVPGAQADADRATHAETQARAIWLQTMLDHFSRRLAEAAEHGRDVTSDRGLKALHVPCVDCLKVAGPKDRSHTIRRVDGKQYPITAACGTHPVDPTVEPMPTW